jgi:16S rRNA processing protein RimM
MTKPALVLFGHIAGAHGVRGEVVIVSHTADPASIGDYGPLQDEAGRSLVVKVLRVTRRGVVAHIDGIGDRDAADALKGTQLYLPRDRLPAVEHGEFYHADLIGLAVEDQQGNRLGEVVAVHNFGAGDLLEVRLVGRASTALIPFRDAFVPVVDIAARKLRIADVPGLLD